MDIFETLSQSRNEYVRKTSRVSAIKFDKSLITGTACAATNCGLAGGYCSICEFEGSKTPYIEIRGQQIFLNPHDKKRVCHVDFDVDDNFYIVYDFDLDDVFFLKEEEFHKQFISKP